MTGYPLIFNMDVTCLVVTCLHVCTFPLQLNFSKALHQFSPVLLGATYLWFPNQSWQTTMHIFWWPFGRSSLMFTTMQQSVTESLYLVPVVMKTNWGRADCLISTIQKLMKDLQPCTSPNTKKLGHCVNCNRNRFWCYANHLNPKFVWKYYKDKKMKI